MKRRLLLILGAALVWTSAVAGDWPEKQVRFVVPFPAGGATDGPARLLAQRLSVMWQQPVIVENRTGAGGALGASEVARSTPDGYTLLFPSGSVMTANQFIYPKLPYDPEKDLIAVTKVVSGPQVLVVGNASPLKSIQDLIAAAKAAPNRLTFGHAGIGSQSHLATEYFLSEAHIQAVSVPYKGDPPALLDIITGSVDFGLINLGAAVGHIDSGRLRTLGVTSRAPLPTLPGVPTIGSVLPGFESSGWFGIVAPRGVPAEVVDKINRDVHTVLDDPEVRGRLVAMGFTPIGNSASEMNSEMQAERKRWSKVVAERNIQVSP
jgi:tripartite-type tricarboxylate transporter receptor subunit TctC